MRLPSRLGVILLIILSLTGSALADNSTRYLAFQIFTGSLDSEQLRRALPPPPKDLRQTIMGLRDQIGVTGKNDRRLGVDSWTPRLRQHR